VNPTRTKLFDDRPAREGIAAGSVRSPRARHALGWLAAAFALAGGALYAFDKSADSAHAAPAPAADARMIVAPALVEARGDRVSLSFEQSGRITEILVDEGDRVTAGQVVAKLDDRIASAQVAKAQASLDAAQARLDQARRGPRKDEIAAAKAEADAASAQAWQTGVSHDRAERLYATNADAIPQAEVDSTKGAADAASAESRAAESRLALLEKGTRKEVIAEAEANVAAAKADLDAANAVLSQMELRAPSAGVVLRRDHEPGEQVTTVPPTVVLVIADTDHLQLRAEIDEVDVAHIAVGQRGWATAGAYGDERFEGRVTRVVGELGRKTQRPDDPRAKVDTRVQEVLFTPDDPAAIPLGLRMDVHLEPVAGADAGTATKETGASKATASIATEVAQ
jgi:multidrug resistance efflux pump